MEKGKIWHDSAVCPLKIFQKPMWNDFAACGKGKFFSTACLYAVSGMWWKLWKSLSRLFGIVESFPGGRKPYPDGILKKMILYKRVPRAAPLAAGGSLAAADIFNDIVYCVPGAGIPLQL